MVHSRVLILAERQEEVHPAVARLAAEGYEVEVGPCTLAGLANLVPPWPDLVLLRCEGLPQVDLVLELRDHSRAPLLVWTDNGDQDEAVRALKAGADDYVGGPLTLDELAARVVAHLRRARWSGSGPQAACHLIC